MANGLAVPPCFAKLGEEDLRFLQLCSPSMKILTSSAHTQDGPAFEVFSSKVLIELLKARKWGAAV
jgi:hypothetical protein